MNELKYVIVCPTKMDERYSRALIFNGLITHSQVVPTEGFRVISAGFCHLMFNPTKKKLQIKCYGKSTSLKINSRPLFDQDIIAKTLTKNIHIFDCVVAHLIYLLYLYGTQTNRT